MPGLGPRIMRGRCERCDKPLPSKRLKFCSDACAKIRDRSPVWPRDCTHCHKPFIARKPAQITCGPACSLAHRAARANRSDDYHRHKRSVRRSVSRETDITPQEEAAMRKRARKCALCGTWMTGKPGKPNSKELDHIVPIGMGGTHTHGNVRIICRLCNLKRPKDGSDYTGPVTLWATAPGVVVKPKPKPAPVPALEKRYCPCGNETHGTHASRCSGCLRELTIQAASMREAGMKWQDICDALDYSNTGSLYGMVMRMRRSETR